MSNSDQFLPTIIKHAGPLSAQIFSYGSVEITPVAEFGPLVITFENGPGGNAYYSTRWQYVRVSQKRNPRLTQVRKNAWSDAGIEATVINILNTIPAFSRFNQARGIRNTMIIPTALPLS